MAAIEWDGDLSYKDAMFISLLGVTDREERIVLVLSDLYWRFLANTDSEPDGKPLTRVEANEFLLSCIANRGINVERSQAIAAEISTRLSERFGSTDLIEGLVSAGVEGTHEVMAIQPMLHRWNHEMAKSFVAMAERLTTDYSGDARNIWTASPLQPMSGRQLLERLKSFRGISDKLANLCLRTLCISGVEGVVLSDGIESLEMPVDVHSSRVFRRLGLVSENATQREVMKAARRIATKYGHPAATMDGSFWLGYSGVCSTEPDCENCPLSERDVCDFPWQLRPDVLDALKQLRPN